MTATLGRTEADYDVRLTDRVAEWERRHPTEAAELRLVVQAQMGMHQPPEGRISRTALEMQFRESVRAKLGWPTLRQFLRGEA